MSSRQSWITDNCLGLIAVVLGVFKSSQGWMGVAEGIQGHADLSPASPWKELTVVTLEDKLE